MTSTRTQDTPRHSHCFRVASYNCRTIASQSDLQTLLEVSKGLKYDVLCLQETKSKSEYTHKTLDGHLISIGEKVPHKNIGGVGFLINKSVEPFVESTTILSPRLATLHLKIKGISITVFNCYAPTSMAPDHEKDAFYLDLERVVKADKAYLKVVAGDFNATIHDPLRTCPRVGPHGEGSTNESGDRLIDLLNVLGLFHGNSRFQKKAGTRWTWESPNGSTHSELDHILVNRIECLFDVGVVPAFQTGSDHRLLRAKIHLRARVHRRDTHRPAAPKYPIYDSDRLEAAIEAFPWAHDVDPFERL